MPESICDKCDVLIKENDGYLLCCECSGHVHISHTFSGVTKEKFRAKDEDFKKSWRCPSSRNAKPSSGVTKKHDASIAIMFLDISRKLDELLPLKQTVSEIEASVKLLSAKYDDVLVNLAKYDGEIKTLTAKVAKIEASCTGTEVQVIRAAVNDLEYHSRKLNLEVHGTKEEKDESLMDKLNDIASKLKLAALTEKTVSVIHRLQSRNNKTPGIIIQFSHKSTKDNWLAKKKCFSDIHTDVFLLENMTVQNRVLLKSAKEWAHVNEFRFAWHRSGKVFVRKEEGESARLIKCVADLDKLIA